MRVFENLKSWQTFRTEQMKHGMTLGFVPTMGALHEGHLSLVRRAQNENDHAAVSIFVNPTQFNNSEDLAKYPRTLERDLALLQDIDADFVLLPNEKEIYADQKRFVLSESVDSKILCGAHRPGHFEGVLTVVMKLLGLAQCEHCYMGEKDYQQYLLISKMAEAFFMNTRIVPCPTAREKSGLAMSSRNARLSAAGKDKAALIYRHLTTGSSEETRAALVAAGFEVEYLEEHWGRRFVAAFLEGVRLIDNVSISTQDATKTEPTPSTEVAP